RSAPATEPPHLGQTLLFRGIAAVVADALPSIARAPASAGPRRLAPLRARPALGVSVGEQQSHYCDTEQNKTDRAHAVLPIHLFMRPIQKARVLYQFFDPAGCFNRFLQARNAAGDRCSARF